MLYIDFPTAAELTRLIEERAKGCVMIVLSTTPLTQHVSASIIELKNLTREAVGQLGDVGFDKRGIAAIEEQIADWPTMTSFGPIRLRAS